MNKKSFLVFLLVVAVLTTGCLENGESEGVSAQQMTPVFQDISLTSSTIRPGREVRVEAEVVNSHVEDLEDVEIRLESYSPLTTESENCEFEEVRGADYDAELGGESIYCEWSLTCEEGSCEDIYENYNEYPIEIDLVLDYSTELSYQTETSEVEYLPIDDIDSSLISRKNHQVSNGDIRISYSFDNPRPVDEPYFEKELEAENIGSGSIRNEELELDYSGGIVNAVEGFEEECNTLIISGDTSSVSTDCEYAVTDVSEYDIYDLSVRGRYKYSKQESITIEITS